MWKKSDSGCGGAGREERGLRVSAARDRGPSASSAGRNVRGPWLHLLLRRGRPSSLNLPPEPIVVNGAEGGMMNEGAGDTRSTVWGRGE